MPRLQRHHLLFSISHRASVLSEASSWNSHPFVIREVWVLAWQKLTVQRLPSVWVFSKLISLGSKNQVRDTGRDC